MENTEEKKLSLIEKIRTDDKLLGIASLIILILIFAIGVGTFMFVRNVLNDSEEKDETEISSKSEGEEEKKEDKNSKTEEDASIELDNTTNVEASNESSISNDAESDKEDDTKAEDTKAEDDASSKDNDSNTLGTNTMENDNSSKEPKVETTVSKDIFGINNYNKGDISGSTHVVVEGDTLWEIAEGYTGSGFDWVNIANKNQDKISYLPNGEFALILPGTNLNL